MQFTWYLARSLLFHNVWGTSWMESLRLWVLSLKLRVFGSSNNFPPICFSICRTSWRHKHTLVLYMKPCVLTSKQTCLPLCCCKLLSSCLLLQFLANAPIVHLQKKCFLLFIIVYSSHSLWVLWTWIWTFHLQPTSMSLQQDHYHFSLPIPELNNRV